MNIYIYVYMYICVYIYIYIYSHLVALIIEVGSFRAWCFQIIILSGVNLPKELGVRNLGKPWGDLPGGLKIQNQGNSKVRAVACTLDFP